MSKLINFYEQLPSEYKGKKQNNPHLKLTHIALPAFILISGRTGSGKTNSVINYLSLTSRNRKGTWDKIVICCKNFSADPLYRFIKDKQPKLVDVYEVDSDGLPDPETYTGQGQILIIFDDLVNEKAYEPQINQFFKYGRKLGFSMAFLTQDYFKTNSFIRKNINYLWLFNLNSNTEKNNILRNYPFMIDYMNLFKELKQEDNKPSNFVNIDIMKAKARLNFD